jgi:hypothetical protein
MESSNRLKNISILLLIGYILIVLFGKYLAIPVWKVLYTTDYHSLDLKSHLIYSIFSIISLIPGMICSAVIYRYSKNYLTNPYLWMTLGFIEGYIAI